jgi:hypothetical protein
MIEFNLLIEDDKYIFINNGKRYILRDKIKYMNDYYIFFQENNKDIKIGLSKYNPILYFEEDDNAFVNYNGNKYYIKKNDCLNYNYYSNIFYFNESYFFIKKEFIDNINEKDELNITNILNITKTENIYKYKNILHILENKFYIEYINDSFYINKNYKIILGEDFDKLDYNIKYFIKNKFSDMLLLYNQSDNKYFLLCARTSYEGIKNKIFEFNNDKIVEKLDKINLFNFDSNEKTTYKETYTFKCNIILFENIYDDIYIPKISNYNEALYFLCICHKYMDFEMLDLIFNRVKQFIPFELLSKYLSGPFYNYYINILKQKKSPTWK